MNISPIWFKSNPCLTQKSVSRNNSNPSFGFKLKIKGQGAEVFLKENPDAKVNFELLREMLEKLGPKDVEVVAEKNNGLLREYGLGYSVPSISDPNREPCFMQPTQPDPFNRTINLHSATKEKLEAFAQDICNWYEKAVVEKKKHSKAFNDLFFPHGPGFGLRD